MKSSTAAVIASGAAAASAVAVLIWKRPDLRRRAMAVVHGSADQEPPQREGEAEDPCAICLEPPELGVRTQCRHRFCADCFRSWAVRQVPPTSTVRCPLCTTPVLSLKPESVMRGTSAQMRWVLAYNVEAMLSLRLKMVSHWFEVVRACGGAIAVGLYVVAGVLWEGAHQAMRYAFPPIPAPIDARIRASSRWLVSAHLMCGIQRFLAPPDERHAHLVGILANMRPITLYYMAFFRDYRHALITCDPPSAVRPAHPQQLLVEAAAAASDAVDATRAAGASVLSPSSSPPVGETVAAAAAGGELLSSAARSMRSWLGIRRLEDVARACEMAHGAAALAAWCARRRSWPMPWHPMAHAPTRSSSAPSIARSSSSISSASSHLRIEWAGVRGLMLLLDWYEDCGARVYQRVRPHESGLWRRRYCEVEEVLLAASGPAESSRSAVGGRPTRAPRAVARHVCTSLGERGLRARGFPAWASQTCVRCDYERAGFYIRAY